jgi:hypothetical protein
MDKYFPPKEIKLIKNNIDNDNITVNDCENNTFLYCLYKYIQKYPNLKSKNTTELEINIDIQIKSVNVIEYLNNDDYDNLLSNNVCFLI